MARLGILVLSISVCLGALPGCEAKIDTPAELTGQPPSTNHFHGVAVVDPHRWLENAADPAVRDWTTAQNRGARALLDNLATRPLIEDRLTRLLSETGPEYFWPNSRGGLLFFLKVEPPAQQPVLVSLLSVTNLSSERVILDPNRLQTNGSTTIDWYVPSLDGKWVAVSLSDNGTEEGTLRIYATADGKPLPDVLPRVQAPTAGGNAAWNQAGTGFYYTRYPWQGERPDEELNFHQQIYFHQLGQPAGEDTYEFGKDLPRIAEIALKSSPDGAYVLASVAHGDGGDYAHYLREPSGQWRRVAAVGDKVTQIEFGRDPLYIEWGKDDALYLLSHKEAPKGKILRLPLGQEDLDSATVIVPEGRDAIQSFAPSASGLCLVFQIGGPSQFAYLDYFDEKIRHFEEPAPSAISGLLVMPGDEILFRVESYTQPYEWLQYSPSRDRGRLVSTALAGKTAVPFTDIEVVREKVPSKDGTLVPLHIIQKRGTRLHGENPVILSGYGGFGISETPRFDISRRLWLDHGGLFAIANVRGGGEFGDSWHQAGALTNKQNVFDDFAACAEFLIRSRYTQSSKLAVSGRSNGGLLMGAALTQRPELMQAVVAHVGLYDMLRAELDPNGAFNVTEYGSVSDPEQFKALHAYSPYHRVLDKTPYPAVLMLSGENDGRVNPAHSRKMIARLQAASSSGRPILLRTSSSGHGPGTALGERVAQLTDVYAFVSDQLGLAYSLVDRGPWSGAVTPASAVVKAKLVREDLSARLLLSQSASLANPLYFGPDRSETNRGNMVQFALARLEPDTQYYGRLEIDGRIEPGKTLEFRTFPGPGPASFTMAFASCARTGSTSDVFDRIRELRPLFYMNTGDFHYLNVQTNDRSRFRAAYDAVLASPQQAELYRQVPFVYLWDDHDFCGNNSNRRASAKDAARLTYAEYVPHYPMPLAFDRDGGPISQAFTVGRVRFILTDLRSERDEVRKRDDAAKTMLGARQKGWFKRELLAANGKYPLICWVSSVGWIGQAGTNVYHGIGTNQFGFIHHSQLPDDPTTRTNRGLAPAVDDWWSVFSTERRELANFIKQNQIQGLCILHGDAHMLGADDGTHSDYATGRGAPLPVMCAAPLDQAASVKGGPFSQGIYRVRQGEGAFGLLTVTDHGERIDVAFSGRNDQNEEKVALRFSVRAPPVTASAR